MPRSSITTSISTLAERITESYEANQGEHRCTEAAAAVIRINGHDFPIEDAFCENGAFVILAGRGAVA